jgi:iron complex outermembrane receptor protein
MRSIFTGNPTAWTPATASAAYKGAIAANAATLAGGLAPQIQAGLGVNAQTAAAVASQLVTFLGSLSPTAAQMATQMRLPAPGSSNISAADVRDIGPIKASFNNTYELGYKGILGSRFRLAIDAWSEKRGDVGNPAGLATPAIFFDSTSMKNFMQTALIPAITQTLMGPPFNMPQAQAQGTAQVFGPQVAAGVAGGLKPLPLGIVSFDSPTFASATDFYATYTSYDQTVTVNGVDISMDFVANDNWTFSGALSWVSDDIFEDALSSNNLPLMLNAPTNKLTAGAAYRSTSGTWGFDSRVRHANAYPVNSGVYATGVDFPLPGAAGTYRYDDIEAATVVDVGFNWRMQPAGNSVLFSIRADNLFNAKYRTMPGTPELGTMVVTRLQYSF